VSFSLIRTTVIGPIGPISRLELRRRIFRVVVVDVVNVSRRVFRRQRRSWRRYQWRHLDDRVRAEVDGDGHLRNVNWNSNSANVATTATRTKVGLLNIQV
jgi:hypothetical protein